MQQQTPAESPDLAAKVADLNNLLRLKTTVAGIKMFARVEDMEAIPKIRRPKAIHTVDLLQWLWPDLINASLRVDARFDESGLAQHAQVLRDRGLRHLQHLFELTDRAFRCGQEREDGAPVGLCDDAERRFHGAYIREREYKSQ